MKWPIGWTELKRININEIEYWKKASSTENFSNGVPEMWFNIEAGAPPQRQRPNEQYGKQSDRFMFEMPPQRAYKTKACEMCDMRKGIYSKTEKTECSMRRFCLQQGTREKISRVEVGDKNRIDRLAALGNGQVPQAMALAWETLGGGIR